MDVANGLNPREGAPWTAADTLKCVVLTAVLDGDERRQFVVAVPGDREVDLKRLETTVAPALGLSGEPGVEAATEEDLRRHPSLVKGYIGPGAGPDGGAPVLGAESVSGLPFLVDPRIAAGTTWITGANADLTRTSVAIGRKSGGWA